MSKTEMFEIMCWSVILYIFISLINTMYFNRHNMDTYYFLRDFIIIEDGIMTLKFLMQSNCYCQTVIHVTPLTHSQTAFDEMLVHNCAVFLFSLNRARVRPQNRTREMEQVTFRAQFYDPPSETDRRRVERAT